jgi:transcription termination factor Rho
MYINYTMMNTYDLKEGDILVGEIRRHFDSRRRLKNVINKPFEVELKSSRWIEFDRDLPEFSKYNIVEDDYIEIVFTHLKRGGETYEIFPGEEREYLDFNPDED